MGESYRFFVQRVKRARGGVNEGLFLCMSLFLFLCLSVRLSLSLSISLSIAIVMES